MERLAPRADTPCMHRYRRQRGQAAVETAIVMPLFTFLVMGLIQLGLAHQARLMTRYAAYKATRAGAIHRAKVDVMNKAALAVLVPITPGIGGKITPPKNLATYAVSWGQIKNNQHFGGPAIVQTTICNPTSSGPSSMSSTSDFDDPQVASGGDGDWNGFRRSRLHAQVMYNYELLIPFANMVLYWSTVGVQMSMANETFNTLRMKNRSDTGGGDGNKGTGVNNTYATAGRYFLPIRANWAMRLQSNVSGSLPGSNQCKVNFAKTSGSDRERVMILNKTGRN